MIPEHLIFLDLETTGTNPLHDRIIEIGLCEVVNGEVREEWTTLLNPQRPFSPFIERLTGITAAMVVDAPLFSTIAEELMEKLAGKVLVAHNARFDYGFLKSEFRRLNMPYQEKTLCTVKLSRALSPQHARHNLDALIQRHGLNVSNRHRALGDAKVVMDYFAAMRAEFSDEVLGKAVRLQLKEASYPPNLPREQMEALPNSPGVYLFYGESGAVLYVGKSIDIRSRVLSHFCGDHRTRKAMRLSQQLYRIDFRETAGELGALLLEARLVKELSPIHNRRLRRTCDLFSLQLARDNQGLFLPEVVSMKGVGGAGMGDLFGVFPSRRKAENTLREIVREQGLCDRVLGLEKGDGACFGYQIKKCRGACVGLEPLALHSARLLQALAALKLRTWPFKGAVGIRERAAMDDRMEIHVFDHWCHLGTADSEESLRDILEHRSPLPFDLDSYKILNRHLDRKGRRSEVLSLSRYETNV